jgi:hypothetical protein
MSCEEERMMVSPPWLEELREQVRQQGLPPQYVERLLQELSDHFQDIQGEKKGMDAEKVCIPGTRMGEPGDLAQFIGSEYRKQHLGQKHPVVMFAVMPVLLLLAIWAGLMLVAFIIESVLGEAAGPVVDAFTAQLVNYGVIWLPVGLTTVIFCRAARRRRVDRRWSLLTAATLAIFPGMTVSLTPSTLLIGLFPAITLVTFIQVVLPLAICGWYSWRGYRLQSA